VVLDPARYHFVIGAAAEISSGRHVGIVSTGLMTERALDAAALLKREEVEVGVLHAPTIKPFDAASVVDFARRSDLLAVAENHVSAGGLASLVAEVLFDAGLHKRLLRIGLPDRFQPCGAVTTLQERLGLTAPHIADTIRAARA
jgi:transketolase